MIYYDDKTIFLKATVLTNYPKYGRTTTNKESLTLHSWYFIYQHFAKDNLQGK